MYWAICSQRVLHAIYKLNPVTRISRNSSAGRTQRLWFKECWFDPTVLHYFSPTSPPLSAGWCSLYSWLPRVKMTEALRIKYIRSILVWEKGFILRSVLSCSNRPGPALIAINSSNHLLTFQIFERYNSNYLKFLKSKNLKTIFVILDIWKFRF